MRDSVFLLSNDLHSLLKSNKSLQTGGGFLIGGSKGKFLIKNHKGNVLEVPSNNIISLGEITAIIGGGYENARKNIPSLQRFKGLKGKKANDITKFAKKLVGGGEYTYTTENGPCGSEHLASIVAPDANCALAPNAIDNVSGNSGILHATQAGGSRKNNINDEFIASYMMLRLNKGKKMVGGSRVPYAIGKELKNLYGDYKTYNFIESNISKKANSWRGGGSAVYRKRLSENLNMLSNMEKKGNIKFSNFRDIQVPLSVLSTGFTQTGAGLPLEYFGGQTENYSSENSQSDAVLTPHQAGGGVTGMPLEYYGGKTENYSSENSQSDAVLTPHQAGGGVTGMPLEYYGGKTDNYSSENSQSDAVLTPHQAGGSKKKRGFKIPLLNDPVMGGILKTLGVFTLPLNALIPFSLLVFAYEKYLSQKYADEPSLTDDKTVDTLLKAKGALSLHPMLTAAMSAI
jgi:hypothetical protein